MATNTRHFIYWAASLLCSIAGFSVMAIEGPTMVDSLYLDCFVFLLHGASFAFVFAGLRKFSGHSLPRAVVGLAALPSLGLLAGKLAGCSHAQCVPFILLSFAAIISFSLFHVGQRLKERPLAAYIGVAVALVAHVLLFVIAAIADVKAGANGNMGYVLVVDLAITTFLSVWLLALDGEKAHHRLAQLAKRDPLTGLRNRRGVLDKLPRTAVTGAVLLCDIDNFKVINDTHGHLAGDLVLQEFSQRLDAVFRRRTDITGRWGGEEFVVVALGITLEAAIERAEVLRHAVAVKPFAIGAQRIAVTLSIGVAPLSSVSRDDIGDVIASADKALYSAKHAGRNQTMAAAA